MKQIKTLFAVCLTAVALATAGVGQAQASVYWPHASAACSSKSFKSGFSSQKKTSSLSSSSSSGSSSGNSSFGSFGHSASPSDSGSSGSSSGKTSFGAFGKSTDAAAAPAPAAARTGSALNKDLSQSAANTNALNTLDARNAAKADQQRAATAAAAPATAGYPAGVGQPVPAAAPIIINNGGGSSSPWLWFMLGQSMGHHDRVVERVVVNPDGSQSTVPTTVSERNEPGFFMHLLRIMFWLTVLAALGWGIYYLAKRKGVAKGANYTLGKF